MSSSRYAIYIAPPKDTPLWRFGSRVLGYDAASGEDVHGFAPAGFDPDDWRRITERPRAYGFHATLKAPFRLAEGVSLDDLESAIARFAGSRAAFDLGPLAVTALTEGGSHGFAAITQMRPSAELDALEHDVVRHFDRFRAPLTEDERRKRKPESLTTRQRDSLDAFGYPHIGPDYRFHMTLSGAIPDAAEVADRLADSMAADIGSVYLGIHDLVLFGQDAKEARFSILKRFPLKNLPP